MVLNDDVICLQEFFDHFGFVVIRNALTPEDCQKTVSEVFSILENGTNHLFKRFLLNAVAHRIGTIFQRGTVGLLMAS